jgi:hypothetical protein
MKTYHAYIVIVLSFIFGCKVTSDEDLKWNSIKNKQDFASFFTFALSNTDSTLHSKCIDSLKKYQPKIEWIALNKFEYYNQAKDSLVKRSFYEYDESDKHFETKRRNIVYVNINSKDSVKTKYISTKYSDYTKLLTTLIDTTGSSFEIPEPKVVTWNKNNYLTRHLIVHIHCEMFPDTLARKASWETLIRETKRVIATFQSIRNTRSKHIFQKEFSELAPEEKKLIVGLVPIFMRIRFYEPFFNIPQPPPPPPRPSMHEKYWPDSINADEMLEIEKELN